MMKGHLTCFTFARRQIIFASDDFLSGFGFQFQPRFFGDASARLGGNFVFPQARGVHAVGILPGGEFPASAVKINSASTHVVAQVFGLQPLDLLVVRPRSRRTIPDE